MDRLSLSVRLVEDEKVEVVDIFINERNLVSMVKEVELPFAEREGRPHLAGSYEGLWPKVVFLPSRHYLDTPYPSLIFLGKPTILGCECLEPGCWALTAIITLDKHTVMWSDFEQPHRALGSRGEWKYDELGEFVFDRRQYEAELRSATERKA